MPATQIMLLPALTTDAPDGKPIGCKNLSVPNFPDSGNSSAALIATLLRFAATGQFR